MAHKNGSNGRSGPQATPRLSETGGGQSVEPVNPDAAERIRGENAVDLSGSLRTSEDAVAPDAEAQKVEQAAADAASGKPARQPRRRRGRAVLALQVEGSVTLEHAGAPVIQAGLDAHIEDGGAVVITAGKDVHIADGGGAVVIAGHDVQIQEGGGMALIAGKDLQVTNGGGTLLAAGRDLNLKNGGGAVLAAGRDLTMTNTGVAAIATGRSARLDGVGSLLLAARNVEINNGPAGVVLAGRATLANGSQPLLVFAPGRLWDAAVNGALAAADRLLGWLEK